MQLFSPALYEKIHLLCILFMTLACLYSINRYGSNRLLSRRGSHPFILLYAFLFIIIVGLRPSSPVFVDMGTYRRTFDLFKGAPPSIIVGSDFLFYYYMWGCAQVMSSKWFFLISEFLYVIPILWACKRFAKNNWDIAMLFCFAAFSFFTYGVNGIRNGLSTSFVLLALSFIKGNPKEIVAAILLSIIAIGFHKSAALPVICMMISTIYNNPRFFYFFWLFSILMSLVAGSQISNVFANLGFDDRLSQYINADIDEEMFSSVGFRWDFLLYSLIPLALGYYLVFKKKVYDKTYLLLLGTYILANSFWIMVIRAEYSNRFAYLSWFMYPIVLSYPLVRLKIWPKTQWEKTAIVMAGHIAFTLIMVFIF